MRLTVYNFVASLLWSDVCILIFCLLRRRYAFIRDYGVVPLICVLLVGFVRFFLPIELPFTAIVPSTNFLPAIQNALRLPCVDSITYGSILLLLWGSVSLVLVVIPLVGIAEQKSNIAYFLRADSTAAEQALEAIKPANAKWTATVIVTPDVSVPSVTGFFQPTFLLPEMKLTQTQLQYILRHELGHFLGKDAWIKLAVQLFKAVFWWNPMVYVLEKDLNYLLEVRSDAYATKGFAAECRIGYVQAVTEVIRQAGINGNRIPNYALALNGKQKNDKLYERMQLVFSDQKHYKKGAVLLYALLAAMILVSYSFVVQPSGFPPIEENFIQVDKSNAYILLTEGGAYRLYVNGVFFRVLPEDELKYPPHNELEIREEN